MKKVILTILYSAFMLVPLLAQDSWNRMTKELAPPMTAKEWTSAVQPVPLGNIDPFLSFFIVWEGTGETFEVRFSENGKHWSEWSVLERDPHNPDKRITRPLFTEAGYRFYQVRYQGMRVEQLTCHFFSPGATPPHVSLPPVNPGWRDEECPSPPLMERSDWCPAGNCPEISNPTKTEVTHLIVHHSAGTNVANDWAAIVRAIWDLHVNGNGWSDIGYNYLIDPEGVIYTGRGNDIMGAHFCARNSQTMGVCVIGNFQNQEPKGPALNSLVQLLSWKSNDREIDPTGQSRHASSGLMLSNISGHRDGCATACPGNQLYPLLPELRSRVADSLAVCQGLSTSISSPGSATLSEAIALAPNPAGEQVRVQVNSPANGTLFLEVFGVDGRRRLFQQWEKGSSPFSQEISLAELPAGYYWMRLRIGNVQGVASFAKN